MTFFVKLFISGRFLLAHLAVGLAIFDDKKLLNTELWLGCLVRIRVFTHSESTQILIQLKNLTARPKLAPKIFPG